MKNVFRLFKLSTFFVGLCVLNIPVYLCGQVVDFGVNRTEGCAGFSAQFRDLSVSVEDPIINWEWNLGGVVSSLRNPGRIFTRPGTYSICLTVTTQSGQPTQLCKPDFIVVFDLPSPEFIADNIIGCPPLLVNFQDNSSSPNGEIMEWSWGLGGTNNVVLSTEADEPISTTYGNSDNFTVSLSVADEKGCRQTISKEDYIETFTVPDILVVADQNATCNSSHVVEFSNLGDTLGIDYVWDFGNGQTFTGITPDPISYNEVGSYDVQVIAIDPLSGCRDTAFLNNFIQVGGVPLEVSASQMSGCAPFETTFSIGIAQSTDSIVWDFGDGTSVTNPEPVHTYSEPGCYDVHVTNYTTECQVEGTLDTCITVFPKLIYNIDIQNINSCQIPHQVELGILTGQALSINWFINDSLFSDEVNPTLFLSEFGSYGLSAEVTSAFGCTETRTLDSILIQPFTINLNTPVSGCTPLSGVLNYSSQSTIDLDSWQWHIYDGTDVIFSSNEENPAFSIPDTGFYHVQLIATNESGCIDTVFAPNYIGVGTPPQVQFEADPLILCLEDIVSFTDSSEPANGWFWDFGDGGTSTDQHPEINYNSPGVFTVTLTAFHNGCSNTDSIPDYIEILLPKAAFKPIYNCDNPYEVYFNNKSLGADSVHWNFGSTQPYNHDLDTVFNPTFFYDERGIYEVMLTVFNFTTGCKHSSKIDVVISDPIANFTVDTTQGCSPLRIQATDHSVDAVSWIYYLQDEIVNSDTLDSNPVIVISEGGLYDDLSLVIEDIHACLDTFVLPQNLNVSSILPGYIAQPNPVCLGDSIFLQDTSISLFAPISSRQWIIEEFLDTFYSDEIKLLMTRRGLHEVNLSITNEWGCVEEIIDQVEVSKPIIDIGYDTLGCTFADVRFTNLSQGTALQYQWDFGDFTSSTEPEPQHFYDTEGAFTACLTATDQWGCQSDTCTLPITILDPIARFDADPVSGDCPPLVVSFDNLSSNFVNSIWDFGDGSGQSDQASPEHIYNSAGLFDVQLIVELTERCTDTLNIDEYIRIDGPSGQFSYIADTSCVPLEITFFATSENPYYYTWDFGDGNLTPRQDLKINDTITHIYSEAGTFIPSLILQDVNYCEVILEGTDPIVTHDLLLDYFIEVDDPCAPPAHGSLFNFSSSSMEETDFKWIINGAINDTLYGIQPELFFEFPGSYSITLEAQNEFCQRSLEHLNPIIIQPPLAAQFIFTDTVYCLGQDITFTDVSTIPDSVLTSRNWLIDNIPVNQDSIFTFSFDMSGSYLISLEITSNVPCTSIVEQHVVILPELEVDVPSHYEVCRGDDVELEASVDDPSNLDYYGWFLDTSELCQNCLTTTVTPTQTEQYIFRTITNAGCIKDNLVVVEPSPLPEIQLDTALTICKNEDVRLNLIGTQTTDQINWNFGSPGLSCLDCTNPIASPLMDTWYKVQVTNEFSCSTTDSIYIQVIQDTANLFVDDHVICEGASIHLESPNGETYNWNTNQNSCTTCIEFDLTPISSTPVFIEFIGPENCPIRDTAHITVKSLDAINAGDDAQICIGEMILLEAQGGGSAVWSSTFPVPDSTSSSVSIQPDRSTTYWLELTEDLCVLNDSVHIIVEDQARIQLVGDTICPGDTAWVPFNGLFDRIDWNLTPDILNQDLAGYIITETKNIQAEAFFRTCESDKQNTEIVVLPAVKINIPGPILYYPNEEVPITISLNYDGDFNIHWTPEDLVPCIDCLDFLLQPVGTFVLNVTVEDNNSGCFDSKELRVQERIFCSDDFIQVPHIFTPNGDGINDEFKILTSFAESIDFFQIFDRWGELVFETKDLSEGWDGTFNGTRAPVGVYVYSIGTPCFLNGRTILKAGDLTLIR